MEVRLPADVRHRPDEFGGVAYVGCRDDFFVLDRPTYALLSSCSSAWSTVPPAHRAAAESLARVEILKSRRPTAKPRSYSGPSFIGVFRDIVTLSDPLVLNCFSTSHCPLKCRYCHANDLMQPAARRGESRLPDSRLDNVIATARLVKSLVAVITGGDPLTRPERAVALIEALHPHKALVLDTSGVAQPRVIQDLLPVLVKHQVHVRVSLDSHRRDVQERLRPLNRQYEIGLSSYESAISTIDACRDAGIPVTVQSVVSSENDREAHLLELRDFLLSRQVHHWVLHLAVEAGAARTLQRRIKRGLRRGGILPREDALTQVWRLMRATGERALPIDIRVTDNANTPNSVLLLGADGVLYTEGLAHHGKVVLFDPNVDSPDQVERLFFYIDRFGHARRYLNWNPEMFDGKDLSALCLQGATSSLDHIAGTVVELERKYRVDDLEAVRGSLTQMGYTHAPAKTVDDRYFDTNDGSLDRNDYVVRVRVVDGKAWLAQKGPRFQRSSGDYGRIELELGVSDLGSLEAELTAKGLGLTWQFVRGRTTFRSANPEMPEVVLDDVPVVGAFVEIEGRSGQIEAVASGLRGLGGLETRNYKEIVKAWCREAGWNEREVLGVRASGIVRSPAKTTEGPGGRSLGEMAENYPARTKNGGASRPPRDPSDGARPRRTGGRSD